MEKPPSGPLYIGISWIKEADYAAFLGIMDDPQTFPPTYREWLTRANKQVRDAKSLGYLVVRAVMDPKEFPVWCRERGLKVDANARRTFAEAEVRRKVSRA